MQKILVIHPPNQARLAIETLLENAGFEAVIADNGVTGLQAAQQQRPDLVVCHRNLNGLSGEQVLIAVREAAELALTPLILLTDSDDRAQIRRGMALGANDCLAAPFTTEELIDTIAARLKLRTATSDRYVAILRKTAERLNRLAYYDSLTDLPNYQLLHQRLSQAVESSQQTRQPMALLTLSLDRLRQVNNVMGYPAGDELIKASAQRLQACLPPGATLARLTAHQFTIVLPELDGIAQASQLAGKLIDALSRPFSLPGQEVFMTISIGIAICPDHSEDINTLLRQADAALSWAKNQKSSSYQVFHDSMPVISGAQLTMETWLRYALERGEFELHYQPQLGLRSGCLEGAEALIRWRHPQQGFIPPLDFIPLAEETGLILPIGQWVLETACQQARQWQVKKLSLSHVAVNLSSVQFNQPDLIDCVAQALATNDLHPSQLELEVTETALMQDAAQAVETLNQLKALGIRLSVDDFGTGYSSLSYLKHLPIDTLKIDNCFVRGVTQDTKNQIILQSTIEMAHRLGLSIVAEGVETEPEKTLLVQYHCDFLQGYWIGRPMPAAALEDCLTGQDKVGSIAKFVT
ncbi:GGDEF domain-containing response regulator [Romeria aff. gracilis LEGE 07310]|uniref:GGDEF domain-containing response regulator n=1 Tax=Vasconcelosia minhoensis LEGE 07310 TaxID=915328 RepID=A0A8J7AM48_9CYAN|nr:GGDEF domain-containing response regulator [Romeria gracilis]MBE9076959.1 GGDEF domain-containing response regulator [Romeria aff. gracilis LEGE 07310]